MKEKRNSEQGIAKPNGDQQHQVDGVGGRQESPSPLPGGGGYQNICTVLNFDRSAQKKRDPRLDELQQMGLQRVWLDVAETIGVDEFLKVWRILDSDHANIKDDGRLLIPMRSYGAYMKFQRNRYIEALFGMGFTAKMIKERLKAQLKEPISIRRINDIVLKHVRSRADRRQA